MENTDPIAPFLGVWWLEAEARVVTRGGVAVPRGQRGPHEVSQAVYSLARDADGLFAHVRWRSAEGVQQAGYRATPGATRDLGEGATMSTDLVDGALRTRVLVAGDCVSEAVRAVEDGALLVTQRSLEDGVQVEVRDRYRRTDTKQVLVYRRDLKMRKGKIAAQCAHGSMAVFFRRARGPAERLEIDLDGPMAAWARGRFTKVVVSCESEADLERIAELARAAGLPHSIITDAGKTEFHGVPTRTVVAVGPAAREEVDAITGPQGQVRCTLA